MTAGARPPRAAERVRLGARGPVVSRLGVGASPFGGVFGRADEGAAFGAVQAALEAGVTYFDTAPAYGATRSERVLGRALAGVDRDAFVLSTKVGKATGEDGRDHLAFDERSIRASLDASCERLGVEAIDVVFLHDFDLAGGAHVDAALDEGLGTLRALQAEGRLRSVGAGIYRMDVWKRVLRDVDLDVALVHNHHTLVDLRAFELLPLAAAKGVGIVNAAPFASGLLAGGEADLIMLDVRMTGMDGYALCRRLKAMPRLAKVPVMFLTSLDAPEDETEGFSVGACDYVARPFAPAVLLARIRVQLDLRRSNMALENLLQRRADRLERAEALLAGIRRSLADFQG